MNFKTFLLRSLDTVFWDSEISEDSLLHKVALCNEAFSAQLALMPVKQKKDEADIAMLGVRVISDIKNFITLYIAKNVPLERQSPLTSDDWFLRKKPGIYPDRLQPLDKKGFTAISGHWCSVWITVNEECETLSDGNHHIVIQLFEKESKKIVAERKFDLQIISAVLPAQKIYVTNWVHYDCIAVLSNTRPFSDEFFKVTAKYVRLAAKNGQNMVLTPAFTPPLDTAVGAERITVQLVKVEKNNELYNFDFSLLERFIKMCIDCGIEYFEHSHLFSQWGAKHAPKIIVHENGKNKKMFGWQTDAASKEYKNFLHAYFSALKVFLKEKNYEKRFFFHVSDEPYQDIIENYRDVSEFVQKELAGYPIGDALDNYDFYEQGLVQIPIVVSDKISTFYKKAKRLWLYYTAIQSFGNLSNRLIGMPQERGRILGVQLYYYNLQGFLNWGFNAHHSRLARSIIDPRISADMGGDFAGGSSFLVYPDKKGAEPSVRLITFRDQMQDFRAMQLLESLTSRKEVCALIEKYIPDISLCCVVTSSQLLDLRNKITSEIEKNTKR